jgi:gag-polyprotein putative aspartyl protease
VLGLDRNDKDAKNSRPVVEALSRFPDQAVEMSGSGKAAVQMDQGRIPLLINGHKASYFFDTGANLSVLSESEAVGFGMEIHKITAHDSSKDINGGSVSFAIAIAKSLTLGDIHLSNVAFLVSGDGQQPFVDMRPGQRGLIGLPVLLALGSVTWTRDGVFEANRSPAAADLSGANICFDDLFLIAQATFEQHAFPFVLDTGAATTELWPKFAKVARDLIRKSGTRGFHTVAGMGITKKFEVTLLPEVVLQLGGESVTLKPGYVFKTRQRTQSKSFYGNLGIDLLRQAQRVTLDFRRMTLELFPSSGS